MQIYKSRTNYKKVVTHFKFNNKLPKSAIELGADMVATSLHKTGGSLTQSSVLLLNKGKINETKVEETLNIFTNDIIFNSSISYCWNYCFLYFINMV